MSDEITIIERQAQHAVMIPAVVGTMKMGKVMGPAYASIMAHLKANNIELQNTDMPFTVYRNINWDEMNKKGFLATLKMMFVKKWDLEIGISCPELTPPGDEIQKLTLEAGRYLRAIHTGPYRMVGGTYTRIRNFASEQNLGTFKDYSIEFYLNDPGEVAAEELQTEVLVPLI